MTAEERRAVPGSRVTLWGIGTPRTHRPQWLAREFGIEYDLKRIGPRTGETRTPEYLAVNPRHKVPALTHGDLILTESAAIMSYLSEAFPAPDDFFVPRTLRDRARLLEWCFFAMSEIDANAIYTIRRHGELKAIYGDAPVAVKSAGEYFVHQIETMEDRFRTAGPFLMGGRISIADVLFVTCLDSAFHYGLPVPEHLAAYHRRLAARPAYVETKAENRDDRAA